MPYSKDKSLILHHLSLNIGIFMDETSYMRSDQVYLLC